MKALHRSARRWTAFISAAAVFGACTSAVDSAVFIEAAPAPADHPVRVYRTQAPACEYEELGFIVWRPAHGWKKLDEGVAEMRQRAREMGGDAIVDFSFGEQTSYVTTTTADSTSMRTRTTPVSEPHASGTVVRFTDPSCAARELRADARGGSPR